MALPQDVACLCNETYSRIPATEQFIMMNLLQWICILPSRRQLQINVVHSDVPDSLSISKRYQSDVKSDYGEIGSATK